MGLFGRKGRDATPDWASYRPTIVPRALFPGIEEFEAALRDDSFEAARAVYEAAEPTARMYLVDRILEGAAPASVDGWPDQFPGDALALLLRGAVGVRRAWDARGSGRSQTVSEDGWREFFARLEAADQDLADSVELRDDVAAWEVRIIAAKGLELSQEERRVRFERGEAAAPGTLGLASTYLDAILPKWGGSVELVYGFIDEVFATTAPGDPRLSLPCRWIGDRFLMDDDAGYQQLMQDEDIKRWLHGSSERFLAGLTEPVVGERFTAANHFAVGGRILAEVELTSTYMRLLDGRMASGPWQVMPEPVAEYAKARVKADLPV